MTWTKTSSANTEEVIQSIYGGAPYLVSYEDESGPSKRPAGLYVRDKTGGWVPALPGKVLPAPISGGLGLQLEMTKVTGRFEGVAVVDGRVTLFTVHSRSDSPESFAGIGGPGFEVIDPVTGRSIDVPAVKSNEHVSFYEAQVNRSGERLSVLIVSIKKRGPFGDGVTFAVVLKPSENTTAGVKLAYKPILLDWRYSDTQGLASRFIEDTGTRKSGFASTNLLAKFIEPRADDPAPVKEWREKLAQIHEGKATAGGMIERSMGAAPFPYLNVETGRLEMDAVPSILINAAGTELLAVYDPVSGRDGLFLVNPNGRDQSLRSRNNDTVSISLAQAAKMRPLLPGAVDCDAKKCLAIETKDSSASQSGHLAVARMKDGRLFLVAQTADMIDAVPLRPLGAEHAMATPKRVSWYPVPRTKSILVSWEFESGQPSTVLYEIDASASDLKVRRALALARAYYTADQIQWRTQQFSEDVIGFDAATPNVDSLDEYQKQHRYTAPHIDLLATLKDGALQEYFPESLARTSVTPRINYVTYEETAGRAKRSGFYGVVAENQKAPQIVAAQFLVPEQPEKKEGEEELKKPRLPADGKLDSAVLDFEGNLGKVGVTAVLADETFEHGRKRFSIFLLLSPEAEGAPAAALKLGDINGSAERVTDFALIKPEQKGNDARILLAVVSIEGAGTYLWPTQLMARDRGRIAYAKDPGQSAFQVSVNAQTTLSMKEVMARLRFQNGVTPLWIASPELNEEDGAYKLINCLTKEEIFPAKSKKKIETTGADEMEGAASKGYATGGTWRQYSYDRESKNRAAQLKSSSEYQTDVFPHFRELLEDLANPKKPARHVVLIVPGELRRYAQDYPMALRMREANRTEFWSEKNYDLWIYNVDANKAEQYEALNNFIDMRDSVKTPLGAARRPFLFASLQTLQQVNRPQPGGKQNEAFVVSESKLGSMNLDLESGSAEGSSSTEKVYPHILYLAATEGRRIGLPDFNPKELEPTYSTLFVGTKEEWERLKAEAQMEERYGLSQHYEVIDLQPPTIDFRVNFIKEILERREIRDLGYKIDEKSFDQSRGKAKADSAAPAESAEAIAARYLVNKIETLSKSNKISAFDGFMKVVNMLGTELTQNSKIRAKRVIDRGVIENLLLKVFSMPINVNLLDSNDPLRILSKPEFPFLWQLADYLAPVELKQMVIKTILSQLTADEVRNVSSSFIIYGDTGSGKSHLAVTLIKALGLKEYSFASNADNKGAWSFFLKCNKIYDQSHGMESMTAGMMTLEDAVGHLDAFLASENGERGFIWFDDLHLAPPRARAFLLKRIRALIENPTFTVYGADRRVRERPTRNLTIGITMNPESDQQKIKKFTSDSSKGPTDAEIIMATLSNDDGSFKVEPSFLARIGQLINLTKFPAQAKGPKLLQSTVTAAKAHFTNNQQLIIVSPETVERLAKAFPDENARVFLSTASRSLVQGNLGEANRLYIMVPKQSAELADMSLHESTGKSQSHAQSSYVVSGQNSAAAIEEFVAKNIEPVAIDATGYRGKIEFLRFVLDNLRKRAFETLLWSMGRDPQFIADQQIRLQIGAPLARAVHHHLETVPFLKLDQLNLDPIDFGAKNPNEKAQFRKTLQIEQLEDGMKGLVKLPEVGVLPPSRVLEQFTGSDVIAVSASGAFTRQHVLAEHVAGLERILEKSVAALLQVKSLHDLPSPEAWLKGLEARDPDLVRELGAKYTEQVHRYISGIFSPALAESVRQSGEDAMTQYDAMRLFAMAFDKALSRLPWGKVARFVSLGLEKATENMSHGQSPGVQHLLFDAKSSPLIPADGSLLLELARNMPYFEGAEPGALDRQHKRFMTSCEALLKGGPVQ